MRVGTKAVEEIVEQFLMTTYKIKMEVVVVFLR